MRSLGDGDEDEDEDEDGDGDGSEGKVSRSGGGRGHVARRVAEGRRERLRGRGERFSDFTSTLLGVGGRVRTLDVESSAYSYS